MSDWNKIFSFGFYRPTPTTYLIIKEINRATLIGVLINWSFFDN